jgi:hypothetical protein
MSRIFVISTMVAALTIAVALAGSLHPSPAGAQAQGTSAAQLPAALGSPAGATNTTSNCAGSDSWCQYCAQHTGVSVCLIYAPGNGIASATGGVDPSNASVGNAGGGGGMEGGGGGGSGGMDGGGGGGMGGG